MEARRRHVARHLGQSIERAAAMITRKRQSVSDTPSQRLNIKISQAAHERLLVHAIKKRVSPGKLVESMIDQCLREFRVQAIRSASVVTEDRLSGDEPVTSPTLAVA